MFSSIVNLFHVAFAPAQADAGPTTGMSPRPVFASSPQADVLIANDDLRGCLGALMRQHGEGRIPGSDWSSIARYLMGRSEALPPSVAHLASAWPRARATGVAVHEFFRVERSGTNDAPETVVARLQALLAYLKEQGRDESWLSHGFKMEFQDLCRDPAIGPLDRVEVVDIAVLKLGPMDEQQLRSCEDRIARLQDLLPQDAYPCIHDALTRISNEASWQRDLFSVPEDPSSQTQRCGMSLAE